MDNTQAETSFPENAIAIVGMAGRFPMAPDLATFWQNLAAGVEGITFFSEEELLSAGVSPSTLNDPRYVRAHGMLEESDLFDAPFFGYSPREAEIMDPQQRLFLECAWTALEDAGYDPQDADQRIGVYAGLNLNSYYTYVLYQMLQYPALDEAIDRFQLMLANDKDYLTTRVSYKLNLRGPSIAVQTACSTSLVAVHLACQSLLGGECDLVLAGGVGIHAQQKSGYYYHEGGIASPDGHCRTFDAEGQGIVNGNGLGIVVLKRLADALADGDHIHAVIRGSACNNDGALKVGYSAPSVQGQTEVIAEALSMADLSPDAINYVEAHGTATPLGDPIEMTALTRAFRTQTQQKQFCAIGSVKSNIGHLGAAAGVAGLLKTVLALEHQQLPPSLHFKQPNPQIDFANSPFYVNTALTPWRRLHEDAPLRAGVSSFGIGGTNVHVVVEEAPPREQTVRSTRPYHLLVLSGRSARMLDQRSIDLRVYLRAHPEANIADIAYTLQVGRSHMTHRAMLVCQNVEDALRALEHIEPGQASKTAQRPVAFLFPGQGSQYVGMAQELYQYEPVFREEVDRCAHLLQPLLKQDIRTLLYPPSLSAASIEAAAEQLGQTRLTQPALFIIEYALARLWDSWGIQPQAMIGHSIGEYVAACLAGVFSLEDGLRLVTMRGQLMQRAMPGAMLALPLARSQVEAVLQAPALITRDQLSIAAVNAPAQTVVAGPVEAIDELERYVQEQGIDPQRLRTSHAFHSALVDPLLQPFLLQVQAIQLNKPQSRYISNVTGDWITDAEATDPAYWVRHLRQEVRFAAGIATLLEAEPDLVLLEVGPGRTLSSFARQIEPQLLSVSSLPHKPGPSAYEHLLLSLGRLWQAGVSLRWSALYEGERRLRLPLPTYPFERQRYWVEPIGPEANRSASQRGWTRRDMVDWFAVPTWRQAVLSRPFVAQDLSRLATRWLVFLDDTALGGQLVQRLRTAGHEVMTVTPGAAYQMNDGACMIDPECREDYSRLLSCWVAGDQGAGKILHLWNMRWPEHVTEVETDEQSGQREQMHWWPFLSMLYLAQALGDGQAEQQVEIIVVSDQLQSVTGAERLIPEQALLLGPCKVIPQEYPHVMCRSIDIQWDRHRQDVAVVDQILAECLLASPADPVVAYRGMYRWVQGLAPLPLPAAAPERLPLRPKGTYLITGGLGGLGLVLAEQLARTVSARLVLIGRSSLPNRADWEHWLRTHSAEDAISQKISKLQELEALGAEVLAVSADVTSYAQMQKLHEKISQEFGPLHGIIHAAGLAGGRLMQLARREEAYAVLEPKVLGTRIIAQVFRAEALDFFALCSSLSSLQGGVSQVDYAAANAFLDAFAHYHTASRSIMTISINWDMWGEVGMAINTPLPADLRERRQRSVGAAITSQEGWEVFCRILERRLPQVAVSTVGLAEQEMTPVQEPQSGPAGDEHEGSEREPVVATLPLSLGTKHQRPELTTAYVASRNEREQQVVAVWEDVLGIEPIGIYDNFFDLGGHSLLATQIVARLRRELRIEVRLRQLLEKPTIAEFTENIGVQQEQKLAAPMFSPPDIVRQRQHGEDVLNNTPAPRVQEHKTYPLSFAQQRLWFLDQLEPGNTIYNICMAARTEQKLDIMMLERSLYEVMQRHESLRTTFTSVAGEPLQVVHEEPASRIPLFDLGALSAADSFAQARLVMEQEGQHTFDLSTGPLLRVMLLILDQQTHVLLLSVHHIILDAWSLTLLLDELCTVYDAFVQGRPSPLVPLALQYGDYAVWQRHWLQGEVLQTHLDFWQRQLRGAQPAKLPTTFSPPAARSHQGASYRFFWPSDLVSSLNRLSRQQEASLFMCLLAAFQVFLYRSTGQEDIVVGTDIANRTHVETEALIGFFVNLLALRTRLQGTATFEQILRQVREMVLEAYTYQHLPFNLIVEHLRLERRLHETPLIQVLFVLQNVPHTTQKTLFELVSGEATVARFDLALFLQEQVDGLSGTVVYSTDLFDEQTIALLMNRWMVLLRSIVESPGTALDLLNLYAEADKQERAQLKQARLHEHLRLLKSGRLDR